ncbi:MULTISPECIES: hypothetical protein [unclassified Mesorhizobium]|uniref:hypothetical protein n=1 Tax=unclassified Mesorhizobium TaxID=325217 RepID=UPI00112C7D33|nr:MULTISPECIES: hypothetical protein [unclassified Mesorhizobium]TPK53812.1 hypothetical protein FJ550_09450 [Mesorhizobium sp. B2-5-2]TPL17179.1 hypothetical protein FJ946_28830 [Mesorhizobium sp. B2-4-7]TPL33410.1 hypothetical protein FJ961_28850 [Mesorhizobium sp. B2-4-5]TPM69150.1 hypothetical protein FJ968_28415 [Mesorhizobium sp. B2-1-6]TPN73635.1 hypothetical protein FJ985_25770 [Mesorhizobium sp. B1-1-2]
MNYSTNVVLTGIKDPTRQVVLEYSATPTTATQRRLAGKTVVHPVIDLGDYTCRAVIDWVDIDFWFERSTQFQFVQAVVEPIIGRTPHVEPIDPEPGNVSTTFRIRFQEPQLKLLAKCEDELDKKFNLQMHGVIRSIEISVDFKPLTPSADKTGRMVGVLARHLFPDRDFMTFGLDRPRFLWSREKPNYLMATNSLMSSDADQPAPIDATFYVGRQNGHVRWRVMGKTIDNQNIEAGTWDELPVSEHRARIEVTLDRQELIDLGVDHIHGLQRFNFAKLQGRYFQFMVPTFESDFARRHPARKALEVDRWKRFLNAGIVGMIAMEGARRSFRQAARPALKQFLRAKRQKIRPLTRLGTGSSGSFLAYEDLNGRAAIALEKLRHRRGG